MVAQVADDTAADLEALFDDNAASFNNGTGGFCNRDQALQGAAVGQEVVDDQNVLPLMEELLGHDNLFLVLMGEGLHLGNKHVAINVDGLGLLGEHHGNAEFLSHKCGNTDTGGLDGQDLGDGLMTKTALEFPTDFLHQGDIHLVIQKTVNFQHITGLNDAVFYDSLF